MSVTSPAILVNRTTQAGFVIWQTRMSPSRTSSNSSTVRTTRAIPSTTPADAPSPVIDALVVRLRLVEPIGVAPVDEIREGELRRRDRADPVARVEPGGRLALGTTGRHDRPRVDRRRAPDQRPQLVVAQEHHVVGLVEPAVLDQVPADLQQHEPKVGVRALVDVEVVVGGERRHPQVDRVGRPHLLERVAGQPVEDLARRRLDVETHRLDRGREVVVASRGSRGRARGPAPSARGPSGR